MVNDPFNIVDEIPRKAMTLFYLVDTSGSMSGAKIGALNTAVSRNTSYNRRDIKDQF